MSQAASLALALGIGVAFGAALERAGLSEPRKLAGQFYLRDFTVLKVMFTAIVTAMLGVFWLGRIGWIDAAALFTPETFLAPQALGGAIFGTGFVLSGLCPGTACVAAASGRGAGVATVGGVFLGVLTTGLALPLIEGFYRSTGKGIWTLPQAFSAPVGVVVFAVVGLALAVFAAVEWFERTKRV